jgi:hypothetical protein
MLLLFGHKVMEKFIFLKRMLNSWGVPALYRLPGPPKEGEIGRRRRAPQSSSSRRPSFGPLTQPAESC